MNQNPQQQNQPAPAPVESQPAAPAPQQPAQPEEKKLEIKFEEDLKFYVTRDVVDDMRFMELYGEVSEDQLKVTKLLRFLLGSDNYESIFTYYESRGQRFTITKFTEVFTKLDKDLNSQPDFLSK